MIRRGEFSSRELVELYLGRIERLDRELNAFRIVTGERALVDAAQADARRGAGTVVAAGEVRWFVEHGPGKATFEGA